LGFDFGRGQTFPGVSVGVESTQERACNWPKTETLFLLGWPKVSAPYFILRRERYV